MDDQSKGMRLAAILAFIAAGLAFIAFGIGYSSDRALKWSTAAAGMFCLAMGWSMWLRAGSPKS